MIFVVLDWQLNGMPLPFGSKFIPMSDFGIVRLEIKDVLAKDAGILTVTATNSLGTASSSGSLKLSADGSDGVITASLHPSGETGLQAIEEMENAAAMHLLDNLQDREKVLQKPSFTTDLPAELDVLGEERILLECSVEPRDDPDLRLDWYHNGLPLNSGSRVLPSLEFGLARLQVDQVSPTDQGVYTCKAINKLGEATTFSKVHFSSPAQSGVDASTIHPRGEVGLNSINKMETRGFLPDTPEVDTESKIPPTFTSTFSDCELEHGAVGHFEAGLEPADDGDLTVEWTFNGKPLNESKIFHRILRAMIF